jgi:hypothetical protein
MYKLDLYNSKPSAVVWNFYNKLAAFKNKLETSASLKGNIFNRGGLWIFYKYLFLRHVIKVINN